METKFVLSNTPISAVELKKILNGQITDIELGEDIKQAVNRSRNFLEAYVAKSEKPVYGVNTGFGFLANTRISNENLEALQENLVRSHACGTGERVPEPIVRLMLFLKIRSLGLGYSGVRLELIERLLEWWNNGITPVVFTQGSLGASGDLAPLAHLALPLLGEGEFWHQGKIFPGNELEKITGKPPMKLAAKEGLALLNGTQFMLAYGLYLQTHAENIAQWADLISVYSLAAWDCRVDPFHPAIHAIRPHGGQVFVADRIFRLLKQSPTFQQERAQVQDPYSFRCIPQVHGAIRDTFKHTESVFYTELNSATDNPNVFPDENLVLSGGNFHGEPLAFALDFLAIAMAELGSISERRTYLLQSGQRGLPLFLSPDPGLHSGTMIIQYTAAALVSENKGLAHPASVDSIPSSNGQEDHVSMGSIAAVKALRLQENLSKILGIEIICASQALWLKQNSDFDPTAAGLLNDFRQIVAPIEKDRILSVDITAASNFISRNCPL